MIWKVALTLYIFFCIAAILGFIRLLFRCRDAYVEDGKNWQVEMDKKVFGDINGSDIIAILCIFFMPIVHIIFAGAFIFNVDNLVEVIRDTK